MRSHSFKTTIRIAAMLAVSFALSGCADSVLQSDIDAKKPYSKLRHAQLFDNDEVAGKKPGSGVEDLPETTTTTSQFIVGLDDAVLVPSAVIERYDVLDGARVTKSFTKVFNGFALDIDTDSRAAILALIEADPDISWFEPDPVLADHPSSSTESIDAEQTRASSLSHVQAQSF